MSFKDEAEKIFKQHIAFDNDTQEYNHPYPTINKFLDALTALHEREVERIIGEDVKPGYYQGDSSRERSYDTYENVIKAEQRRRANSK